MKSLFKCPVVIRVKKILKDRRRSRAKKIKREADPEYRERERLQDRARKAKMSPEKIEAHRARQRKYHQDNKERCNRERLERKKRNRESENETARNYYNRTRKRTLGKILSARSRRDPTIGLHSAIKANRDGYLGDSELIERIERANQLIDEHIKRIQYPSGQATFP